MEKAVAASTELLRNLVSSAIKRYKVKFALTGGIDSRALLAAAKEYSKVLIFFVDKMGIITNKHSDVWVPKKISRKFGLNFSVRNSTGPLPGWFISQLSTM